MKNTFQILVALVATLFISVSLSAMPVDGEAFEDLSVPTYSKGAIKQYALKRVTQGYMFVSVKYGDNIERTFSGESPEGIVKDIMSHEINVETLRPEDEEITVHVYLRGSNDTAYFSGSSKKIELTKNDDGSWSFELVPVTLVLQENIKMPIPDAPGDVEDVEIRIRDEWGNVTQTTKVGHHMGEFYFPTRHAGEFGEIVFIDSKGQEFNYDLESGNRLTEKDFVVEKSVSIDNYREMTLNGGGRYDQWYTSEYTESGVRRTAPVYYLKVTETTTFKVESYLYQNLKGSPNLVSVHTPERGWLEKVGDSFEEEVFYKDDGLKVELEPGEYYLRLEYEVLEESGWNSPPGKG